MDLENIRREVSALVSPHSPGVAVGVYADGAAVLTAAAGAACVEFGVPVDERTRFDIASASKQFTAACVLLLERDGKLRLDDDVRTHVPELNLEEPVTLRQCLQHTGGLPEWYGLQSLTGVPLAEMTEQRLLEMLAGLRRTSFEPGTAFSYSNTGYVLAAVVVGRTAGSSLADFARERLFEPLGMIDSVFRDDASVPLPRLAYGYANADGEPRRADTEESAVGDGGLVTSVADLAPWFGFLADGRVLGADLRDRLLERGVLADGTVQPYAMGIYHGDGWIAHAGGMHGYRSNLLYLTEANVGVAVLANQIALDPVALSHRIARMLRGRAEPPAPEPGRLAPPRRLHWYEPTADGTLTLRVEDGNVVVPEMGTFAAGADGRWHGTGALAGAWLEIDGDRLYLRVGPPSRPPVIFHATTPPAGHPLPDGVFHSAELDVTATVRDGEIRIGRTLKAPVAPAPGGAWEAGPFTLRIETGDLLVSGGGLRRMRFAG
ncbi:serine hydrolase domain-containing protein [Nonomuraea sp. NPDC050790]|uniref:serine hydrolase domain-containing protein n=1 Tax=Nonomuraea sp. NPDC050790 TaxID=3364371 RepID=UPI003797146E